MAGVYLVLFGAMLDIGIVQNAMFGSGEPPTWGRVLPGYGPGRIIVDGAFSGAFHAWGPLALSAAWTVGLAVTVAVVLMRIVGVSVDRGYAVNRP